MAFIEPFFETLERYWRLTSLVGSLVSIYFKPDDLPPILEPHCRLSRTLVYGYHELVSILPRRYQRRTVSFCDSRMAWEIRFGIASEIRHLWISESWKDPSSIQLELFRPQKKSKNIQNIWEGDRKTFKQQWDLVWKPRWLSVGASNTFRIKSPRLIEWDKVRLAVQYHLQRLRRTPRVKCTGVGETSWQQCGSSST